MPAHHTPSLGASRSVSGPHRLEQPTGVGQHVDQQCEAQEAGVGHPPLVRAVEELDQALPGGGCRSAAVAVSGAAEAAKVVVQQVHRDVLLPSSPGTPVAPSIPRQSVGGQRNPMAADTSQLAQQHK
jgi:hypothetical protein